MSNSLTTIYQQTNTRFININYSGSNSIDTKYIDISNLLNYNLAFSPKITQNEIVEKLSISHSFRKYVSFCNYQFNHSLKRSIVSDNSIGIGLGYKDSLSILKYSISYASLVQQTHIKNIITDNLLQLLII